MTEGKTCTTARIMCQHSRTDGTAQPDPDKSGLAGASGGDYLRC